MSSYQPPYTPVGELFLRRAHLRKQALYLFCQSVLWGISGLFFGLLFVFSFFFGFLFFHGEIGLKEKCVLSIVNLILCGVFVSFFEVSRILLEMAKSKFYHSQKIFSSPFLKK